MDTSPILGHDYETVARIVRFADAHELPPVMLLASGIQESGLNVWESTGDGGQSFGCFQIYTAPAAGHGGPPEKWLGYDGLEASMQEMASRWAWAFGQCGGWERWTRDVVRMMYALGPLMQGSIDWTIDQAHTNVSRALAVYALYQNRLIAATAAAPPPDTTAARDGVTALAVGLEDLRDRAAVQAQAARELAGAL